MTTFDNIIGLLAPHQCLGCGVEGAQLCDSCINEYFQPMQSKCAGCFGLTDDFKVCSSCRRWLVLKHVYIAGNYEGLNEKLIKGLKFGYKRQNAESIAKMMAENIKPLEEHILCPIPTASSRIRTRGFDHAKLIAYKLGKETGMPVENILKRKSNVRQLGSTRKQRIEHMKNEFYIKGNLKGRKVLVVDDVMTSGSTLAAAAKVMLDAGAKEVSAVIFARQIS